jgi:nitric oxide reductase NorD protein
VSQAALIAAGSLEPSVMARITRRRSLRLRYLSLEAARAADALSGVMPARVLARLAAVYDGPLPASPQESLAWAGAPDHAVPEAPEWLGTIRPIKVLLAAQAATRGAPTDADRSAVWLAEALRELDDEEGSGRGQGLERWPAPIRNSLASMIQRRFDPGRDSPAEAGGAGAKLLVGAPTLGRTGRNAQTAQPSGRPRLEPGAVPVGRRYPEWDCLRGSYRRDWCAVAEIDPPTPKQEPPLISTSDTRLRRQLARLGLTPERHRHQAEGDGLDLSALVELVVDRAAGAPGDPRVCEVKRRTAHDLGVLVLVDATGSTGMSAEGPRVFDEQRLLAARLTAALEELGVRVATYGFHSRGPKAIRFLRVKDFDDRYDHAAQPRLGGLTPGGFTRLGAAIRHGAHVLWSRAGTSMMLLVLVSDGVPYEDGYEHRYAQEDTRLALRETVNRGIGCACVSVRASTEPEILARVWGEVPHRRLPDASALERHVQPLFRDAMRAATASRRSVGSPAAARGGYAVAPARRESARTRA